VLLDCAVNHWPMVKFRLNVLSKTFWLMTTSAVSDEEVNSNEHSVRPAAIGI
jgi:hypothetical protein